MTQMPMDFYEARDAIQSGCASYPMCRDPQAEMTPDQRRKYRGDNFMTPERITMRRVGPFIVEVSTGTFLSDRMIGLTVFRIGGDANNDYELCQCVHSIDEMQAHLDTLAAL